MSFFALYAFQGAPGLTTGDSGEFATAAETLSIPHAPSYPLYVFSAKIWTSLVPFGNIARKTNLFSSFTSAGALVLFFFLLVKWGVPWAPSFFLASFLGVSKSFWVNSLVTEVFSLHAFWVVLLLYLGVLIATENKEKAFFRKAFLFSFLCGLGAGNHHTLIFVVPVGLFLFFWRCSFSWNVKRLFAALGMGLLGFSIYCSLPFRAAQDPYLNWGNPENLHNLKRTILREDYGSFQLALGDKPESGLETEVKRQRDFMNQMAHETAFPFIILGLAGLILGAFNRDKFSVGGLILFVLSGPFFYGVSQLPFTDQSKGIMERFLIMPMIPLVLGLAWFFKRAPRVLGWVSIFLTGVLFFQNWGYTAPFRTFFLAHDYGRAMLRSVPPGSALFLDGGDDAFYTLAYLNGAEGRRLDLKIHDRGGLIFPNPYGDDFRKITKPEKAQRRAQIEKAVFQNRPLYYSTMDMNVLPGVELFHSGFLVRAGASDQPSPRWDLIILRSLYPLANQEYRSRALACFFPFIRGVQLWEEGRRERALAFLKRAGSIGRPVDWIQVNLGHFYAQKAYAALNQGDYDLSIRLYHLWRDFQPENDQPWSNLGVAYEKKGLMEKAKEAYEIAMEKFPNAAQPVYNLAVYHWGQENWPTVVSLLEETLRRDPSREDAKRYLLQARLRMKN